MVPFLLQFLFLLPLASLGRLSAHLLPPANGLEDIERRLADVVGVLVLLGLGSLSGVYLHVVQMAQLGQNTDHQHAVVVVFQGGVAVEGRRGPGVSHQR